MSKYAKKRGSVYICMSKRRAKKEKKSVKKAALMTEKSTKELHKLNK